MQLKDLLKIDNRFEKSVNLLLDLNDPKKISKYIPTHSTVGILSDYLDEVLSFSGKRANILIGPYGKGKSHLLLVLMAYLSGNCKEETEELKKRIALIDEKCAEKLDAVRDGHPFLPVIINTSSGNLNSAFIRSLNQALKRNGLSDVVPDNYYAEAVKTIRQWESVYPATYALLKEKLDGEDPDDLISSLEHYDEQALDTFRGLFPLLTSGSSFNPNVDEEMLNVYRSVNRILREKHGYKGIFIIFDEFSKYIEGHSVEGFSADMKVLQDICELANSQSLEQLHISCVAHKSIRSYGTDLPKEVLNAFKGVEGRLQEVRFVVSSKNNYELIADAVGKTEAFEDWKKENDWFGTLLEESYRVPAFSSLFKQDDFNHIVGEGTYPLTPLTAMLLLNLSERIAQNERTLFTFLTGKEEKCLSTLLQNEAGCVGADAVYDYFVPLFKEESTNFIHNEWLKAEYALTKTEDPVEASVIKALALIRMINQSDMMNASAKFITLALGIDEETFRKAESSLTEKNLIVYRRRTAAYEFKNNVDVDLEQSLSDCVLRYYSKVNTAEVLNRVASDKHILPKKYNDDYRMTRFFENVYMDFKSFMALSSIEYLDFSNTPDGVSVRILPGTGFDKEEALKHLSEVGESRLIVSAALEDEDVFTEKVKQLLAAERLSTDKVFTEDNAVLVQELKHLTEEIENEINEQIAVLYDGITEAYTKDGVLMIPALGLNRLVSDICSTIYDKTPVINHELINRNNISAQVSKARNTILDDIFHTRNMEKYNTGTSAESTIYRAVFVHPAEDENLKSVRFLINDFIHESKGKRVSFAKIYDQLMTHPIGLRRGVIPLYISEMLMQLEDMPVVYINKKELSIDAQLMASIAQKPEDYSLYVEVETGEKLEYIEALENLFGDYGAYCRDIERRNRLSKLTCAMQSWYRALPQVSTTFKEADLDGQPMKEIIAFRKLFADLTINPREILFEKIPKIAGTDKLNKVYKKVVIIKDEIDKHIHRLKAKGEDIIRTVLSLGAEDDMKQGLKAWYDAQSDIAKNSLLSTAAMSLLSVTSGPISGDTEEIVEKVSKELTGFFVEDWKDGTIETFTEILKEAAAEISEKAEEDTSANSRISFTSDGGTEKQLLYSFDPSNMSTSGHFFQNALEEMMEEYGTSIDNNEKIGILMKMVQDLMK